MSPTAIAILLAFIVGTLCYAIFVTRSEAVFYVGSTLEDDEKTILIRMLGIVSRELNYLAPASLTDTLMKRRSSKAEELIKRSGNPWNLQASEFPLVQVTLAIILGVAGVLVWFALHHIFPFPIYASIIILGVFGFFIPRITYIEAIKARDIEFKRELPDALDLLIISLSTGVTLGGALREAVPQMKPGILKVEFQKISDAIDSGRTLREALDVFAASAPNDSITTFVRSVQEATELNVPILDVLEARGEASRQEFFAMLQQKTATLESKMMLILTPTLIPALLLIVLAPSIDSLVGSLG
jgi:pilus assembly protein TadC